MVDVLNSLLEEVKEELEERNRGRLFKDWKEANEALNLLIAERGHG